MTIGPSTTYAVLRDTLDNIQLADAGNPPFSENGVETVFLSQDQWEAIQEAVSRCQDAIDEGRDAEEGDDRCINASGHRWVCSDENEEISYCAACGADGNG